MTVLFNDHLKLLWLWKRNLMMVLTLTTISECPWIPDWDSGNLQLAGICESCSVSQSHGCHSCDLTSQLPISRINGEIGSKIANCDLLMSCLMTLSDLLNNCMKVVIINPLWSCDVLMTKRKRCQVSIKDYLYTNVLTKWMNVLGWTIKSQPVKLK